jgi:hypothetical protein
MRHSALDRTRKLANVEAVIKTLARSLPAQADGPSTLPRYVATCLQSLSPADIVDGTSLTSDTERLYVYLSLIINEPFTPRDILS